MPWQECNQMDERVKFVAWRFSPLPPDAKKMRTPQKWENHIEPSIDRADKLLIKSLVLTMASQKLGGNF
jgi:hypothetical protein